MLGVTLYGITREEDNDVAVFAMICRVCEGLSGAVTLRESVALLKLAALPTSDAVLANAGVLFTPAAPSFGVVSGVDCRSRRIWAIE